ncbi:MAG: SIS domain-containing protein [bacterium]|nr:SIS domain-containing protein [bacterium]
METEIFEQKNIIPHMLEKYINHDNGQINILVPNDIAKVVLVASGSSYHCARYAVDLIEKISKIEARAIYSSEFLLKKLIPHDYNTLYVFITQSGETSDTIKSVERVKSETNLPTLCITNNENSTIWKLCDYQMACYAGLEQGIAATKSFTSQMLCLVLLSLKLIENTNAEILNSYKNSLFEIPRLLEEVFLKRNEIKKMAKHIANKDVVVITAEGISYSIAKEGALKIKETSYKNISASILGEFMHGHVAVLNNNSALIFISADTVTERATSNLNKIKVDYNPTIAIIGNDCGQIPASYRLSVNCENEIQQLFTIVATLQILALETALKLKRNVDNPKGLHKVVIEKGL